MHANINRHTRGFIRVRRQLERPDNYNRIEQRDITFVPVSGGPKTAALTISLDDPNHPTRTITLKGVGTGNVGIP